MKLNVSTNSNVNINQTFYIWDKIEAEKSFQRPTAREGHAMVYLNDKNKYMVFAGISNNRYADIFTLCPVELRWNREKAIGELPKDLSHCAYWYDPPYFFFHGGRNKEISLTDTYFLDTTQWIWKKSFTLDQPPPRYSHAAVKTYKRDAFIFGGYDDKRNQCFGDMYHYEYNELQLESNDYDKVSGANWHTLNEKKGERPSPRKGHAMVHYNGFIILYGGYTDRGLDDESFYQYSLNTKVWSTLYVAGVKPGARFQFSMNFFKRDVLIIFGGKVRRETERDYEIANDTYFVDLKDQLCSTPFIAGVSPTPRFGHCATFNSAFNPEEYVILGGLDKSFCALDLYTIREIMLTSDKKWVIEHKKMHNNLNEQKDEVYETAKKTIINFKKQLEVLDAKYMDINKKYSELFNTKTNYTKSLLESDVSSNEKKNKQIQMRRSLEEEKTKLTLKAKESRDYNNLLNTQLKINREKFSIISEFLNETIRSMKSMDETLCAVDDSPNKLLLFTGVDLDSLSVKRRNFKTDLDNYKTCLKEVCLFEGDLYNKVVHLQEEQRETFKNDFYLSADEKPLLDLTQCSDVYLDKDI